MRNVLRAIVAVLEQPHYSVAHGATHAVISRFKCDASDCRSDKIDPCVLPPRRRHGRPTYASPELVGARKWQLIVLDARAIGERRQTRWRHGRVLCHPVRASSPAS